MWLRRFSALSCACLLSSIAPTEASAEEYLLQPGDTLSLMIVGAPEMSRTIPIEMDGTAWFPVIGEIAVGETSLKDVRERVAQAYSATGIAQPTGPDRFPEFVQPSQVYVGIEEYRPIYVTGDLLQPRTIDFRPGLTLRQVIALASVGDTGQGGQRAVTESLESALIELSRVYARIWSLKKQLGTDTPQDYDNIFVADSAAIREIAELESSMIAAKAAEREQQKRVIEESIRRAESWLAALVKQKTSEEEGWQLDEQIIVDVQQLFDRNRAGAGVEVGGGATIGPGERQPGASAAGDGRERAHRARGPQGTGRGARRGRPELHLVGALGRADAGAREAGRAGRPAVGRLRRCSRGRDRGSHRPGRSATPADDRGRARTEVAAGRRCRDYPSTSGQLSGLVEGGHVLIA